MNSLGCVGSAQGSTDTIAYSRLLQRNPIPEKQIQDRKASVVVSKDDCAHAEYVDNILHIFGSKARLTVSDVGFLIFGGRRGFIIIQSLSSIIIS